MSQTDRWPVDAVGEQRTRGSFTEGPLGHILNQHEGILQSCREILHLPLHLFKERGKFRCNLPFVPDMMVRH